MAGRDCKEQALRIPRSCRNARRRDGLTDFCAGIVAEHVERILPVTLPVAEAWGGLAAGARARGRGRVLPHADGLIAATARVHDLTPWTRNTRDFADTGVRLHDPWQA